MAELEKVRESIKERNCGGSRWGGGNEKNKKVRRIKRRAFVDPIRTDIDVADMSAANSEANFSSDDELMDELQSAVFQEAKPVTVSKSPISPVFPVSTTAAMASDLLVQSLTR